MPMTWSRMVKRVEKWSRHHVTTEKEQRKSSSTHEVIQKYFHREKYFSSSSTLGVLCMNTSRTKQNINENNIFLKYYHRLCSSSGLWVEKTIWLGDITHILSIVTFLDINISIIMIIIAIIMMANTIMKFLGAICFRSKPHFWGWDRYCS